MTTQDEINRLAEYEHQLRYVYENIASAVYGFGFCECELENGFSPCSYCASKHFVDWFRNQPELNERIDK